MNKQFRTKDGRFISRDEIEARRLYNLYNSTRMARNGKYFKMVEAMSTEEYADYCEDYTWVVVGKF